MNFWLDIVKYGSKDPLKHQDAFI